MHLCPAYCQSNVQDSSLYLGQSSFVYSMWCIWSRSDIYTFYSAQSFQKLIYLHLCTDCFINKSLHLSEQISKALHWAHYHMRFQHKYELLSTVHIFHFLSCERLCQDINFVAALYPIIKYAELSNSNLPRSS